MFIGIGIIISFIALLELNNKRNVNNKCFFGLAVILTSMLCLRYGQGTDYNGYHMQFERINPSASLLVNSLYHGELGWYMLMVIAKRLGMSFDMFIGIISLIMMMLTIRVIIKYSPYKVISLLILYPTYYLTYYYSALRQGLVLCLFLGVGLDLLLKGRFIKYFILISILVFIHSSAAVLFILPFALYLQERKMNSWLIIAYIVILFLGYSGLLNILVSRVGDYFRVSISFTAIIVRIILFFIISKMHKCCVYDSGDNTETVFYNIYKTGFIIYIMFAFAATLSQRLTMPLKAVELLLIPLQLYKIYINKKGDICLNAKRYILVFGKFQILLSTAILIVILNIEMIKNVYSYIGQGNYYSWVTPINYPYISIFDKNEIFSYISHFD